MGVVTRVYTSQMEVQSYEERQEDELEFLQCVFMNDFEDLRKKDSFKIKRPPEIMILLTPQKSIGISLQNIQRVQVSIKLHAKYTTDYPDSPPDLQLLDAQCLSEDLVKDVLKEINELAQERVGEVMMLEIVQHVQAFLHKHERPPVSLYEEMVKRRYKEAEEERRKKQKEIEIRLEQEQRQIEEELKRRNDELLQSVKSLEDSENDSSGSEDDKIFSSHLTEKPGDITTAGNIISSISNDSQSPRRTIRHGEPKEPRKINVLRGKCLGSSTIGGYSVYSGMECESGDLVTVYEWILPCKSAATRTRRIKQVASIRQEFENLLEKEFLHHNLVEYLSMSHQVIKTSIDVEVVIEHINGGNLSQVLRNPITGPIVGQTLQHYSTQLLEVLNYLHSKGIVHNDIRPSLVFLDPEKGIKLCGFTIIKRLSDLSKSMVRSVATEEVTWPVGLKDTRGGKKSDILKLGMIILCMSLGHLDVSYPPVIPSHITENARDFLNKCLDENEYRRYPTHELLIHPFITPSPLETFSTIPPLRNEGRTQAVQTPGITNVGDPLQFQRSDSLVGSPGCIQFQSMTHSRLGTDFEELETLGRGGFGDVIKVRNHLDGRLYAIKKIKLIGGSKMMNKLTREVELLSQMNHENIVRYYNAWIETYSNDDIQKLSGSLESDEYSESDDEESSQSESSDSDDEDIEFEDESMFQSDLTVEQSESIPSGKRVKKERRNSDSDEEVFEFSADFSSGNIMDIPISITVGTQLEANVMDLSPRRFRRSETESSEGIVFQESSSTAAVFPTVIEEKEPKERRKCRQRDAGQIQYLYIQMEFCSNQTLRQMIDSGQLNKQNNDLEWQLFREIVEGLTHIHAQGMIHRDLKPGNVFLNSSGHIKIGDFGLAISFNKHPVLSRQSSATHNPSAVLAGDTGLVGTALYLAPELVDPKYLLKYSQKVDIYSLGIIFFEMCHPPVSTLMERAKILTDIRKSEIKFPDSFDRDQMHKQAYVIKWLLNHNPSERPTSKQLLDSPDVPYKIVDEQLQEVLIRTLQNQNSARYRRLVEEMFSQQNPRLLELSFFLDSHGQEAKIGHTKAKSSFNYTFTLLQEHLRSIAGNIFSKHCALRVQTPLLGPTNQKVDSEFCTHVIETSGKLLSLPHGHWLSFARHILHQDITFLKRYDLFKTYSQPKLPGTHPRESNEYVFDIVTPSSVGLVADAELIAVVSELISELPLLQNMAGQYSIWLNHTSLTSAILNFCSISSDQHETVLQLLSRISNGRMKLSELERSLREKHTIQLSPLAHKTLMKFMSSEVPYSEVKPMLEPVLRNRKSITSLAQQALQDIEKIIEHLEVFKIKEKLYVHPGMVLNPAYFKGVVFQFVGTSQMGQQKRKRHTQLLAMGGRYDKLVEGLRKVGGRVARESIMLQSLGGDSGTSTSVSVCGVSIKEDVILSAMCKAFLSMQGSSSLSKYHALVCCLGRETLQSECIQLVRDLREKGLCVDILHESLELVSIEDIQEFCWKHFITYVIIIERSFWMRKQVKVRTLESGRVMKAATEKVVFLKELADYLQPKDTLERNDSSESTQLSGSGRSSSTNTQETAGGGSLPSISITTVGREKLQGNLRRRMDSQTLSKLLPLLQSYSPKYAIEIVVVDFQLDALCLLAAEINKVLGTGKTDFSPVIRVLTESHNSLGKKYVAKVCESIQEKIQGKALVVIVYSHVIEQCQIILNNSAMSVGNYS